MSRGKTAAVAVEEWKVPIFRKHLDEAGYAYEGPTPLRPGIVVLKVRYEWVHELKPVIEAAQRECHASRKTPTA
jgi:hypothetical protein